MKREETIGYNSAGQPCPTSQYDAMVKDFFKANPPEFIDKTMNNIDLIADIILRASDLDCETVVACLRDLAAIKDDFRVLKDISLEANKR